MATSCARVSTLASPVYSRDHIGAPSEPNFCTHAIIGGFHLGGTLVEAVVPPTVAALQEIAPSHILPAHCTGWPAQVKLSAAMPEAFVTPAVGTRLELTA